MPQLTIDIAALKNNLQLIKKLANGKKVMAMVKANAYGHGLLDVATALPDVDCLAVARFKDAMFLRNNGINKRVVVLSGAQSAQEFALCAQHKIDSVLSGVISVALSTVKLFKKVYFLVCFYKSFKSNSGMESD